MAPNGDAVAWDFVSRSAVFGQIEPSCGGGAVDSRTSKQQCSHEFQAPPYSARKCALMSRSTALAPIS